MGCTSLISITNFSSTIENAKRMFMGCISLENQIPDFPSYVKDISEMYANCVNLKGNVPYFPKSVGSLISENCWISFSENCRF